MGVSKQRVDVITEVKSPDQVEAVRLEVKRRMRDAAEAYARIQGGG